MPSSRPGTKWFFGLLVGHQLTVKPAKLNVGEASTGDPTWLLTIPRILTWFMALLVCLAFHLLQIGRAHV